MRSLITFLINQIHMPEISVTAEFYMLTSLLNFKQPLTRLGELMVPFFEN